MKYKIPLDLNIEHFSKDFRDFYSNYFVDSYSLTRGEIDLKFIRSMNERERILAKQLLRDNLYLKYSHIIDGIGYFKDEKAVPILQKMLSQETKLSLKITIARALWFINKNPLFKKYLQDFKTSDNSILKQAHFDHIWDIDELDGIQLAIDLLMDKDSFVRFLSLKRLNEIECQRRFSSKRELPHDESYYVKNRNNKTFLKKMINNLKTIKCTLFF